MKISDAAGKLGALAHDTRLAVFRLLVEAGPDGLAAGDIARRLDVPPPTLSFHLRDLADAGLAVLRRDGRSHFYAADFEAMNALMAYLTANCCGSRPELCAPVPCAPAAKPRRKEAVRP
jgi:DNA-binding transcriptional ArsR family regulator